MAETMRKAVHAFLNQTSDGELLSLMSEKKLGEKRGYTYFLRSSDIETELSRRVDSHLSLFFGI